MTLALPTLLLPLVLLSPQSDTKQDPKKTPAKDPVRISLRKEAWIRGNDVLLGDLANLQSRDAEFVRSLEKLRVGPAPKGSWARWIDRNEIEDLLAAKAVDQSRVAFQGQPRVQVRAATETIGSDEIVRSAEDVLRALLEKEGEPDSSWRLIAKPRGAVVPLGRKGRRIVARLTSKSLERSFASFRVEVFVDDVRATTVPVQFRLKRFREVLIATQSIRAGQPFRRSNVATKRVEVVQQLGEPLTFPDQAIGRIAALQLRPGQILTPRHITTPPVVRKGDVVHVVATVGKVRVATKGIAKDEGRVGERVAVQIGNRKTPIFAEVYGAGIVLVRQPGRRNVDLSKIPSTPRR